MTNRFTKIAADGAKLADDAAEWVAVLDNSTALIWTVQETEQMNWKEAQAAAANLDTAGFADWRLPTHEELSSLADRTKDSLEIAIDTAFFPDCKSNWYWTSTPASSTGAYAWVVDFGCGYSSWSLPYNYNKARAVRESRDAGLASRQRGVA